MKEFYLVDDDCMNLFETIVQEDESCIIAPMSIIKKIIFWILGEDDDADPAIVMVNSDYDEFDENDSPYLLCYVPNFEFSLGPFAFSIKNFDGPVFIYDKIKSTYLDHLDEETAIPFHYTSEDQEDDWVNARKDEPNKNKQTVAVTEEQSKANHTISPITEEDDGITGFTENYSDGNGRYSSYSFYSTDRDLVENVASHRAEIIDMMSKRKE